MSSSTISKSDPVLVYVGYFQHPKNANFDLDYYVNKHMPLCEKYFNPLGMQGWTVVQYPDDDPSGLFVQAILQWKSFEAWEKAAEMIPNTRELVEDVDKYYKDRPDQFLTRYVGRVLGKKSA